MCNLTEVNLMGFVKDGAYNLDEIVQAQRLSARMGYRMASIELEFDKWDRVNKEDMLTGCSLTGVMDFKNATNITDDDFKILLATLKEVALDEVSAMSDKMKLNLSKLVTCIKPSGTVSLLPMVSSGVHFSHAPHYIRRVRINAKDPLSQAMEAMGFNWNPEVGQTREKHTTKVYEFPIKAPQGKTKYDVSAVEQLELYKTLMQYYVEHNASNTVHVTDKEWDDVVEWVDNNWDDVVGVTFLSLDDSFYQLMPYETITEEEYNQLVATTPKFDYAILKLFETFEEEFDVTDSECSSGVCPVR